MALIDQLAQAIAQFEGFNNSAAQNLANGSNAQNPSQVNNNPGNLRSSPFQSGTNNGFAVFPDVQTGWDALYYQLQLDASRGMDLETFINGYAPPSENNTNNYLNYLTGQLGVGPSTSLSALYDTTTATGTDASISTSVPTDTGTTDESGYLSGDIFSGLFGGDSTGLYIGLGLVGVATLVLLMNR